MAADIELAVAQGTKTTILRIPLATTLFLIGRRSRSCYSGSFVRLCFAITRVLAGSYQNDGMHAEDGQTATLLLLGRKEFLAAHGGGDDVRH